MYLSENRTIIEHPINPLEQAQERRQNRNDNDRNHKQPDFLSPIILPIRLCLCPGVFRPRCLLQAGTPARPVLCVKLLMDKRSAVVGFIQPVPPPDNGTVCTDADRMLNLVKCPAVAAKRILVIIIEFSTFFAFDSPHPTHSFFRFVIISLRKH